MTMTMHRLRIIALLAATLLAASLFVHTRSADAAGARGGKHGLRVQVSGLPAGVKADLRVKGPHGFKAKPKKSKTFKKAGKGRYVVKARPVTAGNVTYLPSRTRTKIKLKGKRKTVRIAYTAVKPRWVAISAGRDHTCGIRSDHTLWCWGSNASGQLGTGGGSTNVPVRVGSTADWSSVSAGDLHTCGIRAGGSAWCWGANSSGQLGIGSTLPKAVPTAIGGATQWRQITGGYNTTCAIRIDRTAWCWGDNGWYQAGRSTPALLVSPTQVGSSADWTQIGPGGTHACGARGGGYCWGLSQEGQLDGIGRPGGSPSPMVVGPGSWLAVAAGLEHSCGIKTDRTLWCWGDNYHGQSGNTTGAGIAGRTQIGTVAWAMVSLSANHSCGLSTRGDIWCWGADDGGALGVAGTSQTSSPLQPAGRSGWVGVSTGKAHTCGIHADGTAACWGTGTHGELGNGRSLSSPTQVPVR